ncbi:phage major capsid protein [Streptomyces antarcticus]|uniref:phage major capsid protein n=1 Tax=Streptomyces antarcticus TaxID=2996458 RepID=UPI0022712C02|nr:MULTISPECIES: phage major capsid protein [unclassified Streptomyces]MCY0943541.1 phage major capsid protein [Streptomyces sp. H34-AA3]MCZ4083550.1 phage major capsid protein [Streptomyces sp. H34-S5]
MPGTIDDLIASIEVEKEAAHKRAKKCGAEVELILNKAQQDGRSNLEADEDSRIAELFLARDQAKTDIVGIENKLANANKIKAEEMERQEQQRTSEPTQTRKPSYDQVARVGREERTYRKEADPHGKQFLLDVSRQFLYGDVEAVSRLSRHMQEERVERAQYLQRATNTGAFTGLVVPQYLTDLYAPATAALRPFADICNRHPLPESGMSVNISRITTASSAALQAAENDAVSETDMDDTLLTIPIRTAAGQQTVSRQAIDRGQGIEDVTMQDLFNRVHTVLDNTLINQATTGLSAVAQATAYTDASPSGAELYPKILSSAAGVEAAMLAMGRPTHAVMHSRRWYWLSSQMSSTWPMINWNGIPPQSVGQGNPASSYGSGPRGVLPCGLEVIVDNNIGTGLGAGTNEDEVFVVPAMECHLWEDQEAPLMIRAEQTKAATLGVLLVAYKYFAYTFGRYPNAMQKISGSGLVTPTF